MTAYLAVKEVKPIHDYQLILTFSNKEKRLFDVKPYLDKGVFKELRDVAMFNTAHISFDTVEWDNQADLDPEVLYKYSKKYKPLKYRSAPVTSIAAEVAPKYRKKKQA
jgi:hypothetical protein